MVAIRSGGESAVLGVFPLTTRGAPTHPRVRWISLESTLLPLPVSKMGTKRLVCPGSPPVSNPSHPSSSLGCDLHKPRTKGEGVGSGPPSSPSPSLEGILFPSRVGAG